jgi:agmatine deiminase
MPAEWEPHAATWLAWPHNEGDWPGKFEPIRFVFADIVRHLAQVERVHICVEDAGMKKCARKILADVGINPGAIKFHHWATDRIWTRDSGPIFVVRKRSRNDGNPRLAITSWRFNAWAKYPDWKNDARLPERVARELKLPMWKATHQNAKGQRHIVLEGGSIDVNGRGTLLTTEECLLSQVQQRNPGVSRSALEQILGRYLGVRHVIWLGKGIAGDDTHGHVDDIARFVGPRTVVAAVETDTDDINFRPLRDNLRRLRAARDQDGKPLRVVELPMPAPITYKGRRLPASYANFYIANGLVLVPTFNDPNDRVALNTLATLFPKRKVVGIYSGDFIWGFGAMHCMTQQQPRA